MGCASSSAKNDDLEKAFNKRKKQPLSDFAVDTGISPTGGGTKNANFEDSLRQVSKLPNMQGFRNGSGNGASGSPGGDNIAAHLANVVDAKGIINREASATLGQIRNASFIQGTGKELMVLEDTTTDPPTRIPLLKKIGAGGFGQIFLGQYNGMRVAVKAVSGEKHVRNMRIPETLMEGDEDDDYGGEEDLENAEHEQETRDEQMAQLEAVLMSLMDHENIVKTYKILSSFQMNVDEDPGGLGNKTSTVSYSWFIIMEHCSVGSLTSALNSCKFHQPCEIRSEKPLLEWDSWSAMETLKDTVKALMYLHANEIIHGDLKAGNVLLSPGGTDRRRFIGKVTDFGLSRILKSTSEVTTKSFGTVTHMPPELLARGTLSTACDVYSMGMLMWEIYMAKAVHKALRDNEVIIKVVNEKLRPEFPPDVPPDYLKLAQWCWTEEHHERPTLEQLLSELSDVQLIMAPEGPDSEPLIVQGQLPAAARRALQLSNSAASANGSGSGTGSPRRQSGTSTPTSPSATPFAQSSVPPPTSNLNPGAPAKPPSAPQAIPVHPPVAHAVTKTKPQAPHISGTATIAQAPPQAPPAATEAPPAAPPPMIKCYSKRVGGGPAIPLDGPFARRSQDSEPRTSRPSKGKAIPPTIKEGSQVIPPSKAASKKGTFSDPQHPDFFNARNSTDPISSDQALSLGPVDSSPVRTFFQRAMSLRSSELAENAAKNAVKAIDKEKSNPLSAGNPTWGEEVPGRSMYLQAKTDPKGGPSPVAEAVEVLANGSSHRSSKTSSRLVKPNPMPTHKDEDAEKEVESYAHSRSSPGALGHPLPSLTSTARPSTAPASTSPAAPSPAPAPPYTAPPSTSPSPPSSLQSPASKPAPSTPHSPPYTASPPTPPAPPSTLPGPPSKAAASTHSPSTPPPHPLILTPSKPAAPSRSPSTRTVPLKRRAEPSAVAHISPAVNCTNHGGQRGGAVDEDTHPAAALSKVGGGLHTQTLTLQPSPASEKSVEKAGKRAPQGAMSKVPRTHSSNKSVEKSVERVPQDDAAAGHLASTDLAAKRQAGIVSPFSDASSPQSRPGSQAVAPPTPSPFSQVSKPPLRTKAPPSPTAETRKTSRSSLLSQPSSDADYPLAQDSYLPIALSNRVQLGSTVSPVWAKMMSDECSNPLFDEE